MHIRERADANNTALVDLWERSVRIIHDFLSEVSIVELYPQVRDLCLSAVEVWVLVDDDGVARGFIDLSRVHVEMPFVKPGLRGRGIGRRLLGHVWATRSCLSVSVNEQNPQARGLYRHYRFRQVGRPTADSARWPFLLLHMSLQGGAVPRHVGRGATQHPEKFSPVGCFQLQAPA